jgi:hypothetical protein
VADAVGLDGGAAPISLVAFVAALVPLVAKLKRTGA